MLLYPILVIKVDAQISRYRRRYEPSAQEALNVHNAVAFNIAI